MWWWNSWSITGQTHKKTDVNLLKRWPSSIFFCLEVKSLREDQGSVIKHEVSLLYGLLRKRVRWIKSCTVIGYLSGPSGLPAVSRKKNQPYSKSDQAWSIKKAGYCRSCSINTQKRNLANVQSSWPHMWYIYIYYRKIHFRFAVPTRKLFSNCFYFKRPTKMRLVISLPCCSW